MPDDVQLIHGDCLDVLRSLEPGNVDAVVTDPPYGLEIGVRNNRLRNGGYGGHLGKEAYASYADTYKNFVALIVPRLNAALKVARRAAMFTGPHIQEQAKADAIGGIYSPAAAGRTPWGSKNLLPILLYGRHPQPGQHRPTVLRSTARAEKNGHPCPKPLEWMRWLIELVTLPGETVLDPFMGSGTTGVACVQAGRKFIGVEIDAGYFAIAQQRITAAREAVASCP